MYGQIILYKCVDLHVRLISILLTFVYIHNFLLFFKRILSCVRLVVKFRYSQISGGSWFHSCGSPQPKLFPHFLQGIPLPLSIKVKVLWLNAAFISWCRKRQSLR